MTWGALARAIVRFDMAWYWAPPWVDWVLSRVWRYCVRKSEGL